jgi:hypothetical protein
MVFLPTFFIIPQGGLCTTKVCAKVEIIFRLFGESQAEMPEISEEYLPLKEIEQDSKDYQSTLAVKRKNKIRTDHEILKKDLGF